MKVIAAIVLATILGSHPTRADPSPEAVLRGLLGFQLGIVHCNVAFHGDMAREIKSEMQRLQRAAALDDAAVRQIAAGLYEDIKTRGDCSDVRSTAIPTALKLIREAARIP